MDVKLQNSLTFKIYVQYVYLFSFTPDMSLFGDLLVLKVHVVVGNLVVVLCCHWTDTKWHISPTCSFHCYKEKKLYYLVKNRILQMTRIFVRFNRVVFPLIKIGLKQSKIHEKTHTETYLRIYLLNILIVYYYSDIVYTFEHCLFFHLFVYIYDYLLYS